MTTPQPDRPEDVSTGAIDWANVDYPYEGAVTKITWERVLLSIHVRLAPLTAAPASSLDPTAIAFEIVDLGRDFPVDATALRDGEFRIDINITRFGGRRQIPNGTWRIRVRMDDAPLAIVSYDGRELERLDEASRVFLYNKNRSVVTVSFGISENIDSLDFLMRTYQLTRGGAKPKRVGPIKWFKRKYLSEPSMMKYAGWIYTRVNRLVGVKKGRVLFASDQRLTIAGNLLRVQERLVERGLDKELDFKYSFRLPKTGGWGTTIRILFLMATSEVILLDDYFGLLKSVKIDTARTRVIQLWHAGSGFKSVGYSRFGNIGSPKLWHPHRQYTYAITGSKHLVPVYAEAFGIEESAVIPTGLPRVDWFLDDDRTARFTEEFAAEHPQIAGKRVILFAPTFRGRSIYTAFYDYSWIDFDALYEAVGRETVVLFRMHHFVKQDIEIPEQYQDRFFDFTRYADGLGLLHMVDLLITDYSSIIYEFSLLDRPMMFYAPDRVNYAATRGFHRDYDETAPGKVCTTFDEVVQAITTGDFEQEKVAQFRAENFDRIDTGAADRVIDWLVLQDAPPSALVEETSDEIHIAEGHNEPDAEEHEEEEEAAR
ncbi:CDP-glycerol glycerophosphotransferase family protein [Microbacterium sp. H1-D42]|uniref:CDP-glycerol glycerophosphotransferase family protein n=1 Tax=Microbacterium sp. H1-D42 TaxID=2925844 RepID=UPI001F53B598|nr:CDP-glycerol glycerophosphotransferase family protein [Microbacterium sp. H1-D42]UNK71046.1 CDP-glycerol glycerophosphotransferase family protein [Microbacterium sp. H1-D42]